MEITVTYEEWGGREDDTTYMDIVKRAYDITGIDWVCDSLIDDKLMMVVFVKKSLIDDAWVLDESLCVAVGAIVDG